MPFIYLSDKSQQKKKKKKISVEARVLKSATSGMQVLHILRATVFSQSDKFYHCYHVNVG